MLSVLATLFGRFGHLPKIFAITVYLLSIILKVNIENKWQNDRILTIIQIMWVVNHQKTPKITSKQPNMPLFGQKTPKNGGHTFRKHLFFPVKTEIRFDRKWPEFLKTTGILAKKEEFQIMWPALERQKTRKFQFRPEVWGLSTERPNNVAYKYGPFWPKTAQKRRFSRILYPHFLGRFSWFGSFRKVWPANMGENSPKTAISTKKVPFSLVYWPHYLDDFQDFTRLLRTRPPFSSQMSPHWRSFYD